VLNGLCETPNSPETADEGLEKSGLKRQGSELAGTHCRPRRGEPEDRAKREQGTVLQEEPLPKRGRTGEQEGGKNEREFTALHDVTKAALAYHRTEILADEKPTKAARLVKVQSKNIDKEKFVVLSVLKNSTKSTLAKQKTVRFADLDGWNAARLAETKSARFAEAKSTNNVKPKVSELGVINASSTIEDQEGPITNQESATKAHLEESEAAASWFKKQDPLATPPKEIAKVRDGVSKKGSKKESWKASEIEEAGSEQAVGDHARNIKELLQNQKQEALSDSSALNDGWPRDFEPYAKKRHSSEEERLTARTENYKSLEPAVGDFWIPENV
jgi:hypothetical protein